MKTSFSILIIPALVAAEQVLVDDYSLMRQSHTPYSTNHPSAAPSEPTITPAPTSDSMPPFEFEQLPMALRQFIMGMAPSAKLEARQQAAGGGGGAAGGGIAPGGGAPPVSAPTQVPSITVYDIGEGPRTYTQTFKSPPDQWQSAAVGTIGLGSIQGSDKLGKVKTHSNPAAPTLAPERMMGAIIAGGVGAAMVL